MRAWTMCYSTLTCPYYDFVRQEKLSLSRREIKITAGSVTIAATLNDTSTAVQVWDALPIEASASTWGDEIYFGIPIEGNEAPDHEVVEFGDLGYWPPGSAFCMFFGPTPMSTGDEIRPASAVNVIGSMSGDIDALKSVRSGASVVIERV